MAITTIIKLKSGRMASFDFVCGLRVSGFDPGRNLDEIATEQRGRLFELMAQKVVLDRRFEELCLEEEILRQAISEAEESLNDLYEIAHPFRGV